MLLLLLLLLFALAGSSNLTSFSSRELTNTRVACPAPAPAAAAAAAAAKTEDAADPRMETAVRETLPSPADVSRASLLLHSAPAPPYRMLLCSQAAGEGPYVLEWLLHHLLLGFDHVVLYDNNPSWSRDEMAARARPFQEAGWLTYVPWGNGPYAGNIEHQAAAHNHCGKHFAPHAKWVYTHTHPHTHSYCSDKAA